MTNTDELQLSSKNGVATLVLNRPEARNAMNVPVLEQLLNELQSLAEDDAVRCVIITGTGDKAFCAGGDVRGLEGDSDFDRDKLVEQTEHWSQASFLLHNMPKPTIAAVNGVAAGAGMSLALSCDLRYLAESASFVTAFAKLAMPGDFGGSYFLTQLVGPAKARELYFLSDRINAGQALELGLANAVLANTELMSGVNAVADRLVQAPATMYRAMKKNLNAALQEDLPTIIRQEAEQMIDCALSPETRAATAAFFNKK